MTMYPGIGLLSQFFERGRAGQDNLRARPGQATLRVCHRVSAGGVAASAGGGAAARWASASRCQARVSSLRATAVVAIFFPRRWAMAWKLAANCGERLAVCAASHSAQRSRTEPCLEMCP